MNRRRAHHRGFTLVELLITIAVIGVLVSVAYPSYGKYMLKSRRAEAQQALMDVALRQQQLMLDTKKYAESFGATGATLPASLVPYYRIDVVGSNTAGVAPTFTATAVRLGTQLADTCPDLTVNQAGVRAPANCW